MIDLRRLRVLRAVAYYGTVTAAAESLHLTASAASQQIRQLGRELDVRLLEPQGRRVRLTQAARGLLAHADAIEARWELAESELHALDGEPVGELRMAGFPSAMCRLLTPVAGALRAEYPRLDVRLREAEPADCYDLLFNGETDLAVVEASADAPARGDRRFEQQTLIEDPFDLVVPEGHPLAARTAVRLTEAAEDRWIIGPPGVWSRQRVLAACSTAGFGPNVTHEACDFTVTGVMVSHGLGVALIPRLAQLSGVPSVRRLRITGTPCPSRTFLTVTRRGGTGSPAVRAALDVLRVRAKETVG